MLSQVVLQGHFLLTTRTAKLPFSRVDPFMLSQVIHQDKFCTPLPLELIGGMILISQAER